MERVVEPRISLVTLGVEDVARARRFYERLGWVASPASQAEVAFFQANGMALALYGRAALAADAGVDGSNAGFSGVTIAQNLRSVREVDETYAEALAAGGKPTRPPHETPWGGYVAYVADPDGHLWELAFNPGFALDHRGDLHLPV
jgi:predicted lactoylglutathione lyase